MGTKKQLRARCSRLLWYRAYSEGFTCKEGECSEFVERWIYCRHCTGDPMDDKHDSEPGAICASVTCTPTSICNIP
jgi:hypothetical protein